MCAPSIGIFDSGVGGLGVLKTLKRLLPFERIAYLADRAHFPYGNKSSEEVLTYCTRIADFFIQQGINTIVIACNTASALGYAQLRNLIPSTVRLYEMISPSVEYVSYQCSNLDHIGIIGTANIIESEVYQRAFERYPNAPRTHALATPLLAPAIEEDLDTTSLRSLLSTYLTHPVLTPVQALFLACTHYPIIRNEINACYAQMGKDLPLLDPTYVLTKQIKKDLISQGVQRTIPSVEKDIIFSSAYTPSFEQKSRKILGAATALSVYFERKSIHL